MDEEKFQHALCTVAVIVVCRDHVLALRRGRHRDFAAGEWELVSGRVREGETLLNAAKRELFEETGLQGLLEPLSY